MTLRTRRRTLLAGVLVICLLAGIPGAALGAGTETVVHVGTGAARLTLNADGTGSLYVNLKGLTPGRWNEHLWSGTCESLGTRVAVLPGLSVPSSGRVARTNPLTSAQAVGRTLRLTHTPEVKCSTFIATPPPPATTKVLVGAGDISSCGTGTDSATADLISSIPGTVFTLGDNVYPDGTAEQYGDCYGPTWGTFKSRTMPIPGNHEYNTPGAAGYFAYFGSVAGTPSQSWYAYDLGSWRIYALDGNCWAISGCQEGSPQEQWLRADLAANPRLCIAAMWHEPRFTSGAHGSDPTYGAFWEDLYAARAELVLNGHDHDYERFAPQTPAGVSNSATGIREIVVGTGGIGHTDFLTTQPNSQVRDSSTFGVLKLTLRSTSYDWQFIPIAGQTFTDAGTTACH